MKDFLVKHKFYIWAFFLLFFLILGRFYYSFMVYNDTFASWDAAGAVLKSLFIKESLFIQWMDTPISEISNEIFRVPIFISYSLAIFSDFLNIDLYNISYLITSILTIVWFLFLYFLLYKKFNFFIAFLTVLLISLNSFIAFYSTEPERAPFIVSFFLIWIYYLYKWWNKNLLIAWFFTWITLFVHITWIFFIWSFIVIYFLLNLKKKKEYLNIYFLLSIVYFWIILFTFKFLNWYFEFNSIENITKDSDFVAWELWAFLSNIKNWFGNSWFFPFINWIKNQITPILFYWWLIGFVISLFFKQYRKIFFLMPFIIIFLWFSLKWEAASHGSRYPFYINWLFIFYFVLFIYLLVWNIKNRFYKIIITSLVIIYFWINNTFYTHYVAWFRHIYKLNKEAWEYIWKNITIDENNKILIMWRGETIYPILKTKWINYKPHLITYWWRNPDELEKINFDFIYRNNISYFVYENIGKDYFNSFDFIKNNLYNKLLIEKEFFNRNRNIVIYKIIK